MNPVQSNNQQIPIISFTWFTKIRDIGEGGFGTVALYNFHPLNYNGPAVQRAIKLLNDFNQEDFDNEIAPFLRLQHPNLLGFYGLTNVAVFYGIVLEYMGGGNLNDVIHRRTAYRYSLKDVLNWGIQSARALEYMHRFNENNQNNPANQAVSYRRYIHRDIKPENMLLDSTCQILKIADFGLSKEIDSSRNTRGKGTPLYMAPEVLEGQNYNEKCDVYSWTLTFWECLTGVTPFRECRNLTALGEKKRMADYLVYINTASENFNKLIQSGSNVDRQRRISMSSWRRILEILFRNCNLLERQNQENNVCVWNDLLTGEFFYCRGLESFNWTNFDSDPLSIEPVLARLDQS